MLLKSGKIDDLNSKIVQFKFSGLKLSVNVLIFCSVICTLSQGNVICVAGLLMEFRRTVKLLCQTVQLRVPSTMKICFFLTGGHRYYFLLAVCWFSPYSVKTQWCAISVLVKTTSSDDGSEIKQMQLLCYDGTHKETKWLAVKSKGAIQVFRMFRLDLTSTQRLTI